jgi:hypothetical protein
LVQAELEAWNTAAMVGPMMTFHAGRTQVIRGIAQELVERLAVQSGTLGHIRDPLGVESCLLLHELFHHDEHLRHGQTDLLLPRKYRKPVPPVYREIAAFAYVNFCMKGPPCQLLDLLWLYRNHPGPWADTIDRYLR